MIRIPNLQTIKSAMPSGLKYGILGAASLPLIDYVIRKYVPQLPTNTIVPQLPTLDSWLINLGVPSSLILAGVASGKPTLTWAGIGALLAGTTLLSALTMGLNLALIPFTVQRGAIATTQALARHGY